MDVPQCSLVCAEISFNTQPLAYIEVTPIPDSTDIYYQLIMLTCAFSFGNKYMYFLSLHEHE